MASGFEVVLSGLAFPESPRWHAGRLFLSEKRAGRVLSVAPDGSVDTVAEIDGEPGGLGWTPGGDLLVVAMAKRAVLRVDARGSQHVSADLTALTTCKCNDMVVDGSGNAYVGDFGYDLPGGAPPAPGVLALARPDGTAAVVATDLHFPNGCVITPAGELIVAESAANRLTAYRIEADGSLTDRRVFADPLHSTVVRVADGGEVLERRATEQGAFACELGGDDGCTLFVCTYDAVASASPEPKPVGRLEAARVEVPRA